MRERPSSFGILALSYPWSAVSKFDIGLRTRAARELDTTLVQTGESLKGLYLYSEPISSSELNSYLGLEDGYNQEAATTGAASTFKPPPSTKGKRRKRRREQNQAATRSETSTSSDWPGIRQISAFDKYLRTNPSLLLAAYLSQDTQRLLPPYATSVSQQLAESSGTEGGT